MIDPAKLFFPQPGGEGTHGALLVMRLVAGAAFVQHGLSKIKNPLAWMGEASAVPGILQALAAISEFFGGVAWMLGALTPLASVGIACTMVVAAGKHIVNGDPFVGRGGSYELALVFLTIALLLLVAGPGRYSIDGWLRSLVLRRAERRTRRAGAAQ